MYIPIGNFRSCAPGVMEEEKSAMETGKGMSPQNAVAPESGCGDTAPPDEVSSPEQKAAAAASTSNTEGRVCPHFGPFQDGVLKFISELRSYSYDCAPRCDHYLCENKVEKSSILVCIDCDLHFCIGDGTMNKPQGHARWHADLEQHCVGALLGEPETLYCFICERLLDLDVSNMQRGDFSCGKEEIDRIESDVSSSKNAVACHHHSFDTEDIFIIKDFVESEKGDPMCDIETCLTTGEHHMMVCSECKGYFCIEPATKAKPQGHIREHALLQEHWVAVWHNDLYVGYCFECEDSLVIGGEEGKEGLAVNAEAGSHASGSSDGHGCVIRGISNQGNTCLNALLWCLLVLGKLRASMFGPNAPLGVLGTILRGLFVDANSVRHAPGPLNRALLLACVRRFDSWLIGTSIHDSHELLCCFRNRLNEEDKIIRPPNKQQGAPSSVAPTVIDSIFGGELSVTTSCKRCSFKSYSRDVFYDLSVPLPPKGAPSNSVASPPQNERPISQRKICVLSEGGDSQIPASELEDTVMVKTSDPLEVDSNKLEQIVQSKDAVHCPLQSPTMKENTWIASVSDVEKTDTAVLDNVFSGLKVSTEAKMVISSAEINSENKGKARSLDIVNDEAEDINSLVSIEECLKLHIESEMIEWTCENCSKVAQKASTISGKDGEQMMASTNVNRTVYGDQAEQSDRKTCQSELSSDLIRLSVECSSSSSQPHGSGVQNHDMPAVDIKTSGDTSGMSSVEKDSSSCSIANKKPECLGGAQEDASSCRLTEKQANLLSVQCQNISIEDQERGNQANLGHNANQLEENQYDQQDRNEGAILTCLISKLPPVLVIQLNRSLGPLKVSGHVSFKEILDVEPFMDPSSEDKFSSRYRLVGVIENRGLSIDIGQCVAYVRANNQQQGSGSSSWYCATNDDIKEISFEEVLKCEAYLLFYERMGC
uniref:USP domain-containing protein n=1 Tax=Oryza meridionalis TaxID=40149 RepID=A0A0E0CE91_9ORYZ